MMSLMSLMSLMWHCDVSPVLQKAGIQQLILTLRA